MKIPILGGTGNSRETDVGNQLTQNWYPHLEEDAKNRIVLYPTPGLTQFTDIGTGPIRGMFEYNKLLYLVSTDTLYEINSGGTAVARGTLNTNVGRVNFAHNGSRNGEQLMLVDGTNGYIWDSNASSFSIITDTTFPDTATHVAFVDSFFIVNDPANSGRWFKSSAYDGTGWDGLEFATAERDPDELQALIVNNREIHLLGEKTAEIWGSSSSPDFPFEPIQSAFTEWGCIAPDSVAKIDGSVYWLTQNKDGDGQVIQTTGLSSKIVSDTKIATEISGLSTLENAYSWTYQYQQHSYYVLTFPTDGKTLVYDSTTNMWHQWSSKTLGYHRSIGHTFLFGKHLVGDPVNGKVYQLDWDKYTDNGDTIVRIRRTQHIHTDDRALRHYAVKLDIKEGVGSANAIDPKITLRWRDNNGAWSNTYQRSMGKVGETGKEVIWRRLGRSGDRVYEIRVTDPANAVLIDGYADIEEDSRVISGD